MAEARESILSRAPSTTHRAADLGAVLGALLINDPVVVVEDGQVRLWSASLEKLTGLSAEVAVGAMWSTIASEVKLIDDQSEAPPPHADGARAAHIRSATGEHVEITWTQRRAKSAMLHTLRPVHDDMSLVNQQLLRYAQDLTLARASAVEQDDQISRLVGLLDRAYTELSAKELAAPVRDDGNAEPLVGRPVSVLDRVSADGRKEFHGLRSGCPKMFSIFKIVKQVASTNATVLIQGESGTGKELIAAALHQESERADGPFVALNSAALNSGVAESLLFGHVKGAFTGAVANHSGVFAQAHGGTLFLDEIAEMPLELQTKLLRALQERTVSPVGSTATVDVDVRIVSATHRDLRAEVRAGRFREDLMYRLRVVPLSLPPLREREGDVDVLLRYLIDRHNRSAVDRTVTSVEPSAVRALLKHAWPGNVRELENVVQYAFAVGSGDRLRLRDLPVELTDEAAPVKKVEDETRVSKMPSEEERVRNALAACGGRIAEAAHMLGMSRATFYRRRRQLGV